MAPGGGQSLCAVMHRVRDLYFRVCEERDGKSCTPVLGPSRVCGRYRLKLREIEVCMMALLDILIKEFNSKRQASLSDGASDSGHLD